MFVHQPWKLQKKNKLHLFSQPISKLTQTTLKSKIAIKSESSIEMVQKRSSKRFRKFKLFSFYLDFDSSYINRKLLTKKTSWMQFKDSLFCIFWKAKIFLRCSHLYLDFVLLWIHSEPNEYWKNLPLWTISFTKKKNTYSFFLIKNVLSLNSSIKEK